MTPLALIVAGCFLAAAVFVLWRPQYAAVGLLVMFPLEQLAQSFFPIAQQRPVLVNAGVAIVAAFAVALRFWRREPIGLGYSNPTSWLLWMLYGLFWMTLAWSPAMGPALGLMIPGVPYYIVLMILLPLLVTDVTSIRPVFVGLLVVGTGIAALILASPSAGFYAGRFVVQLEGIGAGERGNPLALAEMGGMMVVVGALLVGSKKNILFLALRLGAILIGLGLAISSGSRGQVVAAVMAVFLFFPLARGIGNIKQVAGLGVAVVAFYFILSMAFSLFVGAENETRWDVDRLQGGVESRLEHASTLLEAFIEAPGAWLLGLGSNAFNYYSRGGKYVHNVIIEMLCEQGVVGLTLLLLATGFAAKAGWRLIQLNRDDPVRRSTVAALGALAVYMFLLALKQGSSLGAPSAFYLFVVIAKLAVVEERIALNASIDAETHDALGSAEDDPEDDSEEGDDDDEHSDRLHAQLV